MVMLYSASMTGNGTHYLLVQLAACGLGLALAQSLPHGLPSSQSFWLLLPWRPVCWCWLFEEIKARWLI
jgi:hypothetical protein